MKKLFLRVVASIFTIVVLNAYSTEDKSSYIVESMGIMTLSSSVSTGQITIKNETSYTVTSWHVLLTADSNINISRISNCSFLKFPDTNVLMISPNTSPGTNIKSILPGASIVLDVELIGSSTFNNSSVKKIKSEGFVNIPSNNEEILVIAANPEYHPSDEMNTCVEVYNAAIEKGYRTIMLVGSNGINSKQMTGINYKPGTVLPATKYNILYYMNSDNLKGIYYSGDGFISSLSVNGQNPTLESDAAIKYSLNGTTIAANVDFDYNTMFIACACLAYNKPFATAMLYGAKIQKFLAGDQTVIACEGEPVSANTFIMLIDDNSLTLKQAYMKGCSEAGTYNPPFKFGGFGSDYFGKTSKPEVNADNISIGSPVIVKVDSTMLQYTYTITNNSSKKFKLGGAVMNIPASASMYISVGTADVPSGAWSATDNSSVFFDNVIFEINSSKDISLEAGDDLTISFGVQFPSGTDITQTEDKCKLIKVFPDWNSLDLPGFTFDSK